MCVSPFQRLSATLQNQCICKSAPVHRACTGTAQAGSCLVPAYTRASAGSGRIAGARFRRDRIGRISS